MAYQSKLKRSARGDFFRNLGAVEGTKSQPKFMLGFDHKTALDRERRIYSLWEAIEARHGSRPGKPVWGSVLAEARAIASGKTAVIGKPDYEQASEYYKRVEASGGTPAFPAVFEAGRQDLLNDLKAAQEALAATGQAPETVTGQALFAALDAYKAHIWKERKRSSGAKTILDNLDIVKTYISDCDLGALNYSKCDEIYGAIRSRPIGHRYNRPLAHKSCLNYIGEIDRALGWIHRTPEWKWRKPEDFAEINRKPVRIDGDMEKAAALVPTWTRDELVTLNKYATPLERVFLLLGLNCGCGADQSGRLKIGHFHLTGETPYVARIREKAGVRVKHLLWSQTAAGMLWAIENRGTNDPAANFVVTAKGLPFYRKTEAGNTCGAIPSLWNRLLDRIQKDIPGFRRLPFNSVRDTSANYIRRIEGGEIASVHLAHKHQSKDVNLRRYTNPNIRKLNRAVIRLGKYLTPVFEAAGPEPFGKKQRVSIGINKAERIVELRQQGMKAPEIASTLQISQATVYRHLSGKRPIGQN